MTPARLSQALALLRWSNRDAAAAFGYDEASVRQWIAGRTRIPEHVAAWLEKAARWMEKNPAPTR